jgi:hypothetical protein
VQKREFVLRAVGNHDNMPYVESGKNIMISDEKLEGKNIMISDEKMEEKVNELKEDIKLNNQKIHTLKN